jgi:Na+-transporting methylmalonyl-CoA/oxaloacetate decarboxylase beta subunit
MLSTLCRRMKLVMILSNMRGLLLIGTYLTYLTCGRKLDVLLVAPLHLASQLTDIATTLTGSMFLRTVY